MKTPHKHADLIKAWADGAEIEFRWTTDAPWEHVTNPTWDVDTWYRIKSEPKPDVVEKYFASGYTKYGCVRVAEHWERENLKLTFDGETGKLKAAEVIA